MPMRIDSRYYGTPVYDAADAAGVVRPTVGIRRQPPAPAKASAYSHVVVGAETIESIAARFYGSSDAWWRLADNNPLAFPLDLRPGDTLAIVPSADRGQVQRTRRF